jgi:hypothetical protein
MEPAAGLRQVGAALVAGGAAALDDGVGLDAAAAATFMSRLGPALLFRPGARAIGLARLGGRD